MCALARRRFGKNYAESFNEQTEEKVVPGKKLAPLNGSHQNTFATAEL